MQKITFLDPSTNESVLFEIIDQITIEGKRYLLVADEEEVATILKEVVEEDETITYALVEDDMEFQKISLSFMENDEYDIDF